MKLYVLSDAGHIEYLKRKALRWVYYADQAQGTSKKVFLSVFHSHGEHLWAWLLDTGLIKEKP